MAVLEQYEDFVRKKIEMEKCTHKQLSDELQTAFPGKRGFSVRSVKRFCNEKSVRKTCNINDQELDEVVSSAVLQVSA